MSASRGRWRSAALPALVDRAFRFLQRRATTLMLVALIVGLGVQPLARVLAPLVFPFAVGTMLFSLVRMDWTAAGRYLLRPSIPLATAAGAMVAAPFLVHLASGALAVRGTALATGMTLIAATPPLLTSPAYAVLLGADPALAVATSVPANLATPLVMPVVVSKLLGLGLDIGAGALAARLAVFVGVAFAGAALVRRAAGEARVERASHYVDGAMLLCLCTFGIGLMDGIPALVSGAPATVVAHVGGAFALSIALQAIAIACAWPLGPPRALTVGLCVGLRNGILVLGAVGDSAGPEVRLFLIAFQFPLYMLPALMRPLYARLLRARRPRPQDPAP